MQKQKRVYYAHSMQIYNTRREKKELKFLKKHFESICNPNTDIKWDNNKKMEPYFEAVKNSDIVVVSEYMNHIGKGMYEEIKIALKNNILVLCLKKRFCNYRLQQVKDVKVKNIDDWKVKYGKIVLFFKIWKIFI